LPLYSWNIALVNGGQFCPKNIKPKKCFALKKQENTMKTLTTIVGALLVSGIFIFGTLSSDAQNILIDPGFENQTPPSDGGWIFFTGGTVFSTDYADTGNWSLFDSAIDTVAGSFEQFAAAPGSQWDMTGYCLTPAPLLGDPAFGLIQVSFFDIFGNNLGTVATGPGNAQTSDQVDGTATPGEWLFLDTGIATAPAGTAYIQAFTIYVDFSGFDQGVYFDNLSLKVLVKNHGAYVSSIANNAQGLEKAGYITGAQAGAMVSAAAQSSGGK
jgi:hypothetical protein